MTRRIISKKLDDTAPKKLFFYSCGNYDMMSRDGVFETYKKYHIPAETEDAWSRELKQTLLDDILNRRIFQRVYPLSRLNLPRNEIIEAFQIIIRLSRKREDSKGNRTIRTIL